MGTHAFTAAWLETNEPFRRDILALLADLSTLDLDSVIRHRNERRLAALGISRSAGPQIPGEPPYVGDAGEEAVIRLIGERLTPPYTTTGVAVTGSVTLDDLRRVVPGH